MEEIKTITAKQYFKKDDDTDITIFITEIYIKEYDKTIMIQTDFNELIDEHIIYIANKNKK